MLTPAGETVAGEDEWVLNLLHELVGDLLAEEHLRHWTGLGERVVQLGEVLIRGGGSLGD